MKWLYVLFFAVAQISAIAAIECPTMNAGLRSKIMDRHKKYQPPARGDIDTLEYDCNLEKIAKDYLDDPAYLLDSQYGLIKGVQHRGDRGNTIDQKLDEAFKSWEWKKLKEAAEGQRGLEPLIPQHYGCYYDEQWSVVACVYDEPEYDCKLEEIAKRYLDEPWTLLPSEYGSITGTGKRGKSIDENLDEAFKAYGWNKLKEAAEGGHGGEPLIPKHYGCYYNEQWSVLECIYDARIWRADYNYMEMLYQY